MYNFGRKHGFGVYKWPDGSKYSGFWSKNKLSDIGLYEWSDGRSYRGYWKHSKMDVFGIYCWQDGRSYQGEYFNDKKHGYGVLKWFDGREYAGYWANGQQHGPGTFSNPKDGKIKQGLWEHGKPVKWFANEVVVEINSGRYDFTKMFKQEDSADFLPDDCSFLEPPFFNIGLEELKSQMRYIED